MQSYCCRLLYARNAGNVAVNVYIVLRKPLLRKTAKANDRKASARDVND